MIIGFSGNLSYIGWKITLFPEFSEDMNVIISTNIHSLELIKGSLCSSGRVKNQVKRKVTVAIVVMSYVMM